MSRHTQNDLTNPNDRHSGTPADLVLRTEPRRPVADPKMGIAVAPAATARSSKHQLVTIGDSLTQGFQSGAIWNTTLSWPRIVAWEMGIDTTFVVPSYRGFGGMPFNIERLLRSLEGRIGSSLDSIGETVQLAFGGLAFYEDVASHWKGAWDQDIDAVAVHNLASFGWDLHDVLETTASLLSTEVAEQSQFLKSAQARAAYRVLAPAGADVTPLQAARKFGEDGGIETLIVMIGSNNALGTVTSLNVNWSRGEDFADRRARRAYTIWRPEHFKAEFERIVAELASIDAEHVILATIPHVTVPPVSRGISRDGGKIKKGSRYFEYYTRPWVAPSQFDWRDDACLTAGQARAVDSAIDDYNDHIATIVERERRNGRDWYLLELAGLLDRLASRRYLEDSDARPKWWEEVGGEYPLPPVIKDLNLNSHFFRADRTGRLDGGFFALDGVHPTTVGYGIIAQEVLNVMHAAGVKFHFGNAIDRPGPIGVDFARLLKLDSLLASPPPLSSGLLDLLSRVDTQLDGVFAALGLHFPLP